MRRIAGITIAAVGLGLIVAPAAQATGDHGGDHKVLVCHNVAHNPQLLEVDKNSTKYQGHLMHRTQPQNLDKVQGVDGNADAIKAFCATEITIPGPTVTVTDPPVTVTVTAPPVTETVPGPTTTITEPPTTATVPGPTTTETVPGPVVTITEPPTTATVPGPTTTETLPAVVVTAPSTVTRTVAGPVKTKTVVRDGKESLAYTGADLGLMSIGFAMLGGGVLLLGIRRRVGNHQ